MIRVQVQTGDFDLGVEAAAIAAQDPGIGGVASFVGLVRAEPGLISLTLEHYPGMTEKLLKAIADLASTRFELSGVTIIHRVGTLHPGDQIVLVVTAAAHRAAALAGTQFLIDWLKTDAPFWKQERLESGSRWIEPKPQDDEARSRWL